MLNETVPLALMPEMPHAGEEEGDVAFFGFFDYFVVPYRTTGFHHDGNVVFGRNLNVRKWGRCVGMLECERKGKDRNRRRG
jgi:hypothetical protein